MISRLKGLVSRHAVSEDELSALADGMLAPAREAEVSRHLETCESCRKSVAELQALKSVLAAMPREAPSRSFALSPAQAGSREAARGPGPAPRLVFAPALALSVLLVLLAIDFTAIGGGSGRNDGGTMALSTADETAGGLKAPAEAQRESGGAGAAPAPSVPGTPGGALQRNVEAPVAADAAAPTPAANFGANAAPTPGGGAPGTAAPTPSPRNEAGGEDRVPLIRVLEGAALLALAASLAYVFVQSRKRSGFG